MTGRFVDRHRCGSFYSDTLMWWSSLSLMSEEFVQVFFSVLKNTGSLDTTDEKEARQLRAQMMEMYEIKGHIVEEKEQPSSVFRNASGRGWEAVCVVRSLELPPSSKGAPGRKEWREWKQGALGWDGFKKDALSCSGMWTLQVQDGEGKSDGSGASMSRSVQRFGNSCQIQKLIAQLMKLVSKAINHSNSSPLCDIYFFQGLNKNV